MTEHSLQPLALPIPSSERPNLVAACRIFRRAVSRQSQLLWDEAVSLGWMPHTAIALFHLGKTLHPATIMLNSFPIAEFWLHRRPQDLWICSDIFRTSLSGSPVRDAWLRIPIDLRSFLASRLPAGFALSGGAIDRSQQAFDALRLFSGQTPASDGATSQLFLSPFWTDIVGDPTTAPAASRFLSDSIRMLLQSARNAMEDDPSNESVACNRIDASLKCLSLSAQIPPPIGGGLDYGKWVRSQYVADSQHLALQALGGKCPSFFRVLAQANRHQFFSDNGPAQFTAIKPTMTSITQALDAIDSFASTIQSRFTPRASSSSSGFLQSASSYFSTLSAEPLPWLIILAALSKGLSHQQAASSLDMLVQLGGRSILPKPFKATAQVIIHGVKALNEHYDRSEALIHEAHASGRKSVSHAESVEAALAASEVRRAMALQEEIRKISSLDIPDAYKMAMLDKAPWPTATLDLSEALLAASLKIKTGRRVHFKTILDFGPAEIILASRATPAFLAEIISAGLLPQGSLASADSFLRSFGSTAQGTPVDPFVEQDELLAMPALLPPVERRAPSL